MLWPGDGSDSSSMAPGASAQQFRPSLSSADNLNAIIDVNIPLGQQGFVSVIRIFRLMRSSYDSFYSLSFDTVGQFEN